MSHYVAYYRVSTKKQGKSGLGLDGQKAIVSHYCGAILKEYTEVESGTTMDRPILEKAIAYAIKHQAILVVAKADRLSRDQADAMGIVKRLKEGGTSLLACDCPDVSMIGVLFFFAQREAELISIRTKAALDVKKAQGAQLGRPKGKKAHVNTIRALKKSNTVRRIKENSVALEEALHHVRDGKTHEEIAKELNKRGIKTRTGGQWYRIAVQRLIWSSYNPR